MPSNGSNKNYNVEETAWDQLDVGQLGDVVAGAVHGVQGEGVAYSHGLNLMKS